jgi:hypothetical protein
VLPLLGGDPTYQGDTERRRKTQSILRETQRDPERHRELLGRHRETQRALRRRPYPAVGLHALHDAVDVCLDLLDRVDGPWRDAERHRETQRVRYCRKHRGRHTQRHTERDTQRHTEREKHTEGDTTGETERETADLGSASLCECGRSVPHFGWSTSIPAFLSW